MLLSSASFLSMMRSHGAIKNGSRPSCGMAISLSFSFFFFGGFYLKLATVVKSITHAHLKHRMMFSKHICMPRNILLKLTKRETCYHLFISRRYNWHLEAYSSQLQLGSKRCTEVHMVSDSFDPILLAKTRAKHLFTNQ